MMLCLFEDRLRTVLRPLTHLHPDFDLRCGAHTPRQRLARLFPGIEVALLVRDGLANAVRERSGVPVNTDLAGTDLFVAGSALLTPAFVDAARAREGRNTVFVSGGTAFAALCADGEFRTRAAEWASGNADVPHDGADAVACDTVSMVRYPWDFVSLNGEALIHDAAGYPLGAVAPDAAIDRSAVILAPEAVHVAAGARIGAGVVVDARDGPVIVDREAHVMHLAAVIGPAYVGPGATVNVGAKIRHATAIGPYCKVGGEVEGTVFHSFANKQHDGFAGHSYFAPWTNVGAGSNTSDLKNTYTPVRMTIEGTTFDTGSTFLGTVMADHAKCGINTMFTTGTSVGVGCNVFGAGYPPAFLPSFTWGGAEDLVEYDFARCRATAATVMARRGRTLTAAEDALLRAAFDATAPQRAALHPSRHGTA